MADKVKFKQMHSNDNGTQKEEGLDTTIILQ